MDHPIGQFVGRVSWLMTMISFFPIEHTLMSEILEEDKGKRKGKSLSEISRVKEVTLVLCCVISSISLRKKEREKYHIISTANGYVFWTFLGKSEVDEMGRREERNWKLPSLSKDSSLFKSFSRSDSARNILETFWEIQMGENHLCSSQRGDGERNTHAKVMQRDWRNHRKLLSTSCELCENDSFDTEKRQACKTWVRHKDKEKLPVKHGNMETWK